MLWLVAAYRKEEALLKRKMLSVLSLWLILAGLLCGCRAEKAAGDAQAASLPASIAEKLEQAENVVSTSGYLYAED